MNKPDKKAMVSVCMITYNHEPYIRQAIDGILMQKTDFPFELFIGEDCSKDNTRQICLEYKEKYPDKIKLLCPEKNLGAQQNFIQTVNMCNGKYIAFCEGDDYWTDPMKLQKQLDFMEANIKYSLCYCRFKTFNQETKEYKDDENGHLFNENIDRIEFDLERFYLGWHIGTQTMLFRKSLFDADACKKYKYFRDIHLVSNLLMAGKGTCLNFFGAVYRKHSVGIHTGVSALKGAEIAYLSYKEIYNHNKNEYFLRLKFMGYARAYCRTLLHNKMFFKAFKIGLNILIFKIFT
jgi:glycosyltransferase involved in cell wall biosynthesis